jgi:predicted MFS family arabinose efflux permease
LNLVYLPLYAAGIVGPATGGLVVALGGIAAPFIAGALVFLVGSALIWATGRSRTEAAYSGS